MNNILEGLPHVFCHIDDILIFGNDQQEHDERLKATLQAIQRAGLTLNHEKCQFNKSFLSFLGYNVDSCGISQDPEKTKAITKMEPTTMVTNRGDFWV